MSFRELASAAAVLLASTAGVYYWKLKPKPNTDFMQVQLLTPESYKEIAVKIRECFNNKYWPELKTCREQRRRCNPASPEYQAIVLNFQKVIKRILDESTHEVLTRFRIPKQTFEDSVNFYDSDPELKEYGENIIKPLPVEISRSKLDAEKTKQILFTFNQKLKERNADYVEVDEYITTTSQIEDEIFRAYKIEMEEFNAAVEKHKDFVNEILDDMKQTTSAVMASSDNSF